jgi:hypothetical protein
VFRRRRGFETPKRRITIVILSAAETSAASEGERRIYAFSREPMLSDEAEQAFMSGKWKNQDPSLATADPEKRAANKKPRGRKLRMRATLGSDERP